MGRAGTCWWPPSLLAAVPSGARRRQGPTAAAVNPRPRRTRRTRAGEEEKDLPTERADLVLDCLKAVTARKVSLDEASLGVLLRRGAKKLGAWMLLRMLLAVGPGPVTVTALENLFDFAFEKGEFVGPGLGLPEAGRCGPVLSVGSGLGQVELWLAERGFDVTGVDADEDMVAAASLLAERVLGKQDRPSFVVSRASTLPFPDGTFGAVLFLSSLHEIKDRLAVLAEAGRVLAPDGVLVVAEDGTTWERQDLLREVEGAGFAPSGETRLPEILDHGVVSPYIVRRFRRG